MFHLTEGELAGILGTTRHALSTDDGGPQGPMPGRDRSDFGTRVPLSLVPDQTAPAPGHAEGIDPATTRVSEPRPAETAAPAPTATASTQPSEPTDDAEPTDTGEPTATGSVVESSPALDEANPDEAPSTRPVIPATGRDPAPGGGSLAQAAPGEVSPHQLVASSRPTQVTEVASGPVTAWAEAARTGAGQWSPVVTVEVLGPPRVTVQGHALRHGLRGKTQELLLLLMLHPEGMTPDAIGEALWPGQTATSGMLRSAMKRVRAHLRQATELDQAFIIYGDGRYHPDRRLIGCDAWRFEDATERAAHAPADAERAAALAECVALYRGPLLDGTDFIWLEPYREALRHHALQAYVRHAAAMEPDDPEAALSALERALAIDAYNETLYRRVMRLQARLDRPEAVAGTLQLLRRQLADIGPAPERQTETLATSLQRAETTTPHSATRRSARNDHSADADGR